MRDGERLKGENGPWKMNLDFTVRGASLADAERKADQINRAAVAAGCSPGHTDASESDSEPEQP